METLPDRKTWGILSSEKTEQYLAVAERNVNNIPAGVSEDEKIRIKAEADELWLRTFIARQKKIQEKVVVKEGSVKPTPTPPAVEVSKTKKVAPEALLAPEKKETIADYESFETARGSRYTVLKDGRVQRFKTALLDPNYNGADKGTSPERTPSDITLFYDPDTNAAGWFDSISATDPETGKTVSKVIDIGVYVKDEKGLFHLVRNNKDLTNSFVFVRVRRNDEFKLKETMTFEELKKFDERTFLPENKGLGVLVPSDHGEVTNIPKIGFCAFDFRFVPDGRVASMHNGNEVISIKKK